MAGQAAVNKPRQIWAIPHHIAGYRRVDTLRCLEYTGRSNSDGNLSRGCMTIGKPTANTRSSAEYGQRIAVAGTAGVVRLRPPRAARDWPASLR